MTLGSSRLVVFLLVVATSATAQMPSHALNGFTIGGLAEEELRIAQLRGSVSTAGFLVRSMSSLTPWNDKGDTARAQWRLLMPELSVRSNSDLPYSPNDGARWAGRGASTTFSVGLQWKWRVFHATLFPEYVWSANDPFPLPAAPPNAVPPPTRHPLSSPWHANGQSIDLPVRFGEGTINRIRFGQSSVAADYRNAALGFATENQWWGPGIQNGLLLSNNAEGFPHAFARTRRPYEVGFGSVEARWLIGWLNESSFFDSDPTNDVRAISALAVTFSPKREPGFTVGLARSVISPASGPLDALGRALQIFSDVGHPNARAYLDSTITPGRDQLISTFFRWVHPQSGFEAYVEWARSEFPRSLRDFLVFPNHSRGATAGVQWLGDSIAARGGHLRIQAELTSIEQSPTYRFRDTGSWYTSRAVVQGFTHRGQTLGASIGPGSSSQFVAVDYLTHPWRLGGYVSRVRWLEDAHSQQEYPPNGPTTYGWCEHDVSVLPGIRGTFRGRFGEIAVDYSTGWRLNVFFENPGPCPVGQGRDVRTNSLAVRLTPKFF